jgi:hypothetical protein
LSVGHPAAAFQKAKPEMPKIYTGNGLVLIMLHLSRQQRYLAVTNRERVGRTISPRAPRSRRKRLEMNTSLNQGSAKIYQFPVGGRSALAARRPEETKAVTDLASSRVTEVAVGGAWYHDAAIQDAKPVRER